MDFEKGPRPAPGTGGGPTDRDVLSWCLYPKVVEAYFRHRKENGYLTRLGSHVFFHGLAVGETNKVNIADGKTLVIKYLGLGDADEEGKPHGAIPAQRRPT